MPQPTCRAALPDLVFPGLAATQDLPDGRPMRIQAPVSGAGMMSGSDGAGPAGWHHEGAGCALPHPWATTIDGNGPGSAEAMRHWQRQIKELERMMIPGDSDHAVATHAAPCTAASRGATVRRAMA